MKIALVLIWIVLSVAIAILAERKGRSFELFLNVSLLFSPLIGFVAVLATRPTLQGLVEAGRVHNCPSCSRIIPSGLRTCPHCQARQPRGDLRPDVESTIWHWLGLLLLVILCGFAGLSLFGLLLDKTLNAGL